MTVPHPSRARPAARPFAISFAPSFAPREAASRIGGAAPIAVAITAPGAAVHDIFAAPRCEVDVLALRRDWAGLRAPEDLARLARRHGLTRTQALRLADARFALRVDEDSAREVLRAAAASGTPLIVKVALAGAMQRCSGPVRRIETEGPWLIAHGAGHGLHLRLREDLVDQAWLVRTPTSDGLVTSLELFDLLGDTIATFHGQRQPGRPEPCAWRRITDRLAADPAWADPNASSTAC